MRAALLHPPDRDALSGSARSCWALTGWAGWADSVWAPSWSWTWAGESVGSGDQRLGQKHRRPSWDERKRSGTAPAGKEVGRCRRSHRRSWCSRSPLLSETGPTHCCVWTQRVKSMSCVFAALTPLWPSRSSSTTWKFYPVLFYSCCVQLWNVLQGYPVWFTPRLRIKRRIQLCPTNFYTKRVT